MATGDDRFAGVVDTSTGGPRLVGSTCGRCGTVTFPAQASCPRCTATDTTATLLPERGVLWAYTVQAFPPKEPYVEAGGPFRPFGVGYVDLGDVLVESRLVAADLGVLRVGLPMEVVAEELTVAATGETLVGYAFAPVGEGAP